MLLLILFPQNGRSPTLRTYNSGAKLQIKIERTKKKGEKLASCSLGYNELINVSQAITAMLENLKCLSLLVNKTSAPTVIAELY